MSNSSGNRDRYTVKLRAGHWKKLIPFFRESKKYAVWSLLLIPVAALLRMALPVILKETVDRIVASKEQSVAVSGGLLFLVMTVGEYFARAGQRIFAGIAVQKLVADLRMVLVRHLVFLPAVFHDKQNSGVLTTRTTGDFTTLQNSLQQGILGSLVDVVAIAGSLAGIYLLDLKIGLIVTAALVLLIPMIKLFSFLLRTSLHRARHRMGILSGFALECFHNFSAVKALSAGRSAAKKFNEMNRRFRNARIGNVLIDALLYSLIEGIAAVLIGVLLWYSVVQENFGINSPGLLIALVAYIQQIFEPLKELSNKIAQLQGAATVLERVFGLLEVQDSLSGDRLPPAVLDGKLQFSDVSFRYKNDEDPTETELPGILQNLSFQLPRGKSLAIVGRTGSGKTTLLRLLLREYDGYTGSIELDGIELSRFEPGALRSRLGIVPQETVIFRGSVEFNLSLGNPAITTEMIIRAARETGADRFIRKLPGGYSFFVQAGGGNLSHGQRQLIAFTRALASNPELLILDEATSSVDPASEKMVQRAIDRLLRGRTVLIVAHRLTTVQHCDIILVMEQGKIVERGSHEELLELKGQYFRMIEHGDFGCGAEKSE